MTPRLSMKQLMIKLKQEKKAETWQLKKIELAKRIVKTLEKENELSQTIVDQNKEIIRLLDMISRRLSYGKK